MDSCFFHMLLITPVLLPSVQAACSSETLIRSTLPFVWQYSCTTPARTPRKPRSTWCLTWTTSRRPTASPSPTPVSQSQGGMLRSCTVGFMITVKQENEASCTAKCKRPCEVTRPGSYQDKWTLFAIY